MSVPRYEQNINSSNYPLPPLKTRTKNKDEKEIPFLYRRQFKKIKTELFLIFHPSWKFRIQISPTYFIYAPLKNQE